ncbi:MAG TPA: hypothetical protein PK725_07215 [Rhodocyclaceae bacterium]|nr:hypothetical protein [Rhodocyclaceae bacterium]HRQ46723.1 hypothetical protein [Rhodocyclaceae bacterium]
MRITAATLYVWLLGLATLVLTASLIRYLAPLGTDVVALQLAFHPPNFGHIVHSWSPDELHRYRQHLPFAFALALSYGTFGYLLATRTPFFTRLRLGWRRFAKWSLPLAAISDAGANALHLWLTAAPRFGLPTVYATSAGLSLFKWGMLIGFALATIHALAKAAE